MFPKNYKDAVKRIICAIDTKDIKQANKIISQIDNKVIIKLGLEFYCTYGYEGIYKLKEYNKKLKIFLDLKFHDIPNTVVQALHSSILNVNPYMLTLHASGGSKMLESAVNLLVKLENEEGIRKPMVLAVTVLTSLNDSDMLALGWKDKVLEQVLSYAQIAVDSGCDGLVCSAKEANYLREKFGNSLVLVTPGIRPENNDRYDQKRVVTPKEAINLCADYLVIGRPITQSIDPEKEVKNIVNSII